jgi:hypothetical protein
MARNEGLTRVVYRPEPGTTAFPELIGQEVEIPTSVPMAQRRQYIEGMFQRELDAAMAAKQRERLQAKRAAEAKAAAGTVTPERMAALEAMVQELMAQKAPNNDAIVEVQAATVQAQTSTLNAAENTRTQAAILEQMAARRLEEVLEAEQFRADGLEAHRQSAEVHKRDLEFSNLREQEHTRRINEMLAAFEAVWKEFGDMRAQLAALAPQMALLERLIAEYPTMQVDEKVEREVGTRLPGEIAKAVVDMFNFFAAATRMSEGDANQLADAIDRGDQDVVLFNAQQVDYYLTVHRKAADAKRQSALLMDEARIATSPEAIGRKEVVIS